MKRITAIIVLTFLFSLEGMAQETATEQAQPPSSAPAAPQTPTSEAPTSAEQAAESEGLEEGGFKQVQLETIHFTMIGFEKHEIVRQIQQQMYSIPGVQNFIPYLITPGLTTYDLRYSGPARLLFKALQDVFTPQYVVDIKEIGDKAWEITMRKHGG